MNISPPLPAKDACMVISWNGEGAPCDMIDFDADCTFDIVIFCYTDVEIPSEIKSFGDIIKIKSECKGDIFRETCRYIASLHHSYHYVGIFDDDIEMSVSDINEMIERAKTLNLDSFSASLTHDSYLSHRKFLSEADGGLKFVDWVEVMAPFYQWTMLEKASAFLQTNISSHGIDQFVMPMLQKLHGFARHAVFTGILMRHGRPITSNKRRFSNGLTAFQERCILRRECMNHIRRVRPDLVDSHWWFETFAPWHGPWRFWLLRWRQPFNPKR